MSILRSPDDAGTRPSSQIQGIRQVVVSVRTSSRDRVIVPLLPAPRIAGSQTLFGKSQPIPHAGIDEILGTSPRRSQDMIVLAAESRQHVN